MTNHFPYKCSRRSCPKLAAPDQAALGKVGPDEVRDKIVHGGGSGGGAPGGPEEGSGIEHHDGTYSLIANQIQFLSSPPLPPTVPEPYIISMMAAGMGMDGRVEIGGSQGVRVTAGPPMMPPGSSESTNGAEIVVGELQNITLQRGLIPEVDQQIMMAPGSIIVDGGAGTIMIKSLTSITLQVAEGLSQISLTPAGIIIQGLLVSIN
jgi:hypothetical protein